MGDYYLQSNGLAQSKKDSFKKLVIHAGLYAVVTILFFLVFYRGEALLLGAIFSFSHFLVDSLKFIAIRSKRVNSAQSYVYAIDQILHLLAILILTIIFSDKLLSRDWGVHLATLSVNRGLILRFVLTLLLISKPVNISFKILFSKFRPKSSSDQSADRSGEIIGTLERILIMLMLLANQYTAIWLIFTAKSIIRFDKDNENKGFAEYFLIGTFYSIIATVVIHYLIFKIS